MYTGQSLLVTGGAGFIGSHLVDRLVGESPRNLVVVDNLFLGRRENLANAMKRMPNLKIRKMNNAGIRIPSSIINIKGAPVGYS